MTNRSGVIPVEFKVLVLPDVVSNQTEGGIYLTDDTHERDEMAQTEGVLIAVSDMSFGDWECRIPQIGERVKFARYAGISVEGKDEKAYRIINDKDVVAILGE